MPKPKIIIIISISRIWGRLIEIIMLSEKKVFSLQTLCLLFPFSISLGRAPGKCKIEVVIAGILVSLLISGGRIKCNVCSRIFVDTLSN